MMPVPARWFLASCLCLGAVTVLSILHSLGLVSGVSFGSLLVAALAVAWVCLIIQGRSADEVLRELGDTRAKAEALVAENFKHRNALDHFASALDIMILIVDPKMVIRYANKLSADSFGQEKLSGQTVMGGTLSAELENIIKRSFESGLAQRAEVIFNHPVIRTCNVQVWPEPPEFGRAFVVVYDQTAMKRVERMRRDFVANVSHELRTPMATIRAMAETIRDDDGSDIQTQRRFLKTIIKEVDRLANVTKDLLTLSVVESEAITREEVDLYDVARHACHIVQPQADKKGLEVKLTGGGPVFVEGSHSLLSQVVLNLMENAVAYTNQGSVEARVRADDGFAVLEIIDTGIGIGSEHVARVFERFYRVDKGRSRATGGTGLGLSIVKNIVEAHGGKISVESLLHQGTTFRVELPTELL